MAKIKCVQTEDPDLRKKETYVDGLGRTVLERVFLGSQALETYYVYDVYGRLRWITTPRGSQLLREVIGSTHLQDSEFAQSFCYVYNYDGRGNVIEKRIPGAGAIFLSYDKGDRVISQEDGLLRAAGGPLITEYDIFGREVRETHPDSTVLFKKVYDVYPNDSPTGLDFQMSHLPGLPLSVDTPTGQLTYEEYTIIGGEGTIKRAMYYDWYGNNIQTVELYPDGGILRISRTFDWLGNVLMAKHTFSSSDGTCTDALTDTFTYDSRGRCISEYSGLNNGAGVSRSRSYDVLGRVGKEWTGYSGVEEKRSYNPQGWLTGQTVTKMETDTLFYSTLNYYDIPTSSTFPKASRTGNISKWEWKQRGAEKAQYAFNYDSAGRLIVASETSGPQGYFSFSENYDYDFNTVLMRIVRTGYKSNNKAWVSFYQGRRQENSYDANGNVTFEPLGGLRMEYNLMNLPQQIITASQDTVRYTYSADGVKLSATADSFSYYYRGPFRYRIDTSGGMVLESSAAGACGRIVRQANGTMAPLWFIIDHLGSVRVVRDLYGNVVEQADYSPYGERINQEYLVSGSSDYLFGGKESQQAFGIPLYDSGARFQFLDGIFTSIDPLCEQTPSINPYTYCAGNPVNLVDPTGENWYSYIDETGTIRYVYYEGQLSQDRIKEKGYTDLGYTFMDEQNGMYYSLFGSILSKKDSDGNSSLNYFLNKKIDDLLIKVYSSTEGEGTVSFYSGMKAGCYPFTYNGRHFSSRKDGTLFWAFNNVENSRLHILQMPPKKERRFGGYNNAPNWFGSFMILSNNKNYYAIQINYSASDGARLNQAIVKLFKEK
ncbi:MAG: hypothetical protein IJ821_02425 [Lachnospiraceae bacterium]|nr:hypothetical protein [Lachnospiraceae bacterium]